jgi:hypothetical protein
MEPRNFVNSLEEVTGTTARWFMDNAIPITRAEFERLTGGRKKRTTSGEKSFGQKDQMNSEQLAREFASAAPSLVNGSDEESPTRMWDPSHLSIHSKNLVSQRNGSQNAPSASCTNGEGAREPVVAKQIPRPIFQSEAETSRAWINPPHSAPTQRQNIAKPASQTVKIWPQPLDEQASLESFISDPTLQPMASSDNHMAHSAFEQPSRSESANRSNASAAKRARAAVPRPLPPVPQRHSGIAVGPQRSRSSHSQLPAQARNFPDTRLADQEELRNSQSRTWAWNSMSTVALFVFVLLGRFLIADPSDIPTKGPDALANTKAATEPARVKVEALGSNAPSAATTIPLSASTVSTVSTASSANQPPRASATSKANQARRTSAASSANQARRVSAEKAARRAQVSNPSSAARPVIAARVSQPQTAPVRVDTPKTGMLRINSRPWSRVFVDGKPAGNTPQMALEVKAGRHTIKLVNESLGLSKTIKVKVEPGQIATAIVNLIE